MNNRLLVAAIAAVLAGCASRATTPSAPARAAVAPTGEPNAAELRRDLFVYAADSFLGRETGTPAAHKAAQFIAERLASLGIEPGGDSGYYQRVPMTRTRLNATTLSVARGGTPTNLKLGTEIAIIASLGAGAPLPKLEADADIVFASYAVVDSVLGRNDLSGVDLAGKTIVAIADAPPGVDSTRRAQLSGSQGLIGRLGMLLMRQPAAVVLLLPDSVYRLAATEFAGITIALATGSSAGGPRVLPLVAVAPLSATSPFLPSGGIAARSGPIAGARFQAKLDQRAEPFNGYNVVGIVRGTDAARRGTYVSFGAHYDHVGVDTPVKGDSIYNGADDDGSGSVGILAIARAWAAAPQPRSGLFIWHIGEEKGLLGSEYFTSHPTVPIDSIVANLNADMIGRNHPDTIYVVGPAAAPNGQSRVLGTLLDAANATLSRPFTFDRTWDSPDHPERIYFRSDHFNYARRGIPIVFFTTGLHPQYHQPSDEPSLVDYDKLARVATLMFRTGVEVARRPTRPK
jgi:hypothetical protein